MDKTVEERTDYAVGVSGKTANQLTNYLFLNRMENVRFVKFRAALFVYECWNTMSLLKKVV